jgi:hypothetical protein
MNDERPKVYVTGLDEVQAVLEAKYGVRSAEEAVVTVSGKGGRPEGDREAWMVKLFVNAGEKAAITSLAERTGESVAGLLKQLALSEASRAGIFVPPSEPSAELVARLLAWAETYEGEITTASTAGALNIAPANASKALVAAGFTKRRRSPLEPIWEPPGR